MFPGCFETWTQMLRPSTSVILYAWRTFAARRARTGQWRASGQLDHLHVLHCRTRAEIDAALDRLIAQAVVSRP